MPIRIQDYLNASLVLVGGSLINTDGERASFQQSMDAELVYSDGSSDQEISSPMAPLQALPIRRLEIRRDRVVVEVIPSRGSTITQEYPSTNLSVLARTATIAISSTEEIGDITAHGYNVELVYDQTSEPLAVTYVANRVFSTLPRIGGWEPSAGTAKIRFRDDSNRTWNVAIEPRFNDDNTRKIFFRLNLHFVGGPNLNDIGELFQLVIEKANEFVSVLDEG